MKILKSFKVFESGHLSEVPTHFIPLQSVGYYLDPNDGNTYAMLKNGGYEDEPWPADEVFGVDDEPWQHLSDEEKEIVNNNVSSLINSEALFESNKTIKIKEVKNHDSFIVSKSVIKNNLNQFRSKESVIQKKVPNKGMSDEMILLTILCFLIPFLAVGLATDWDITKVLICLILSLFFWIPGVIYALLVVLNKI